MVILVGTQSCSTVRVPQNEASAKKIIQRNKRQIEAIISFHRLDNPFETRDTVIFNVPERRLEFSIQDKLSSSLSESILREFSPIFIPGSETEAKEVIRNIILPNTRVDHQYSDEYITINIHGPINDIKVEYIIAEINKIEVVVNEGVVIDTEIKWYQVPFLKLILVLILIITIILIIKKYI